MKLGLYWHFSSRCIDIVTMCELCELNGAHEVVFGWVLTICARRKRICALAKLCMLSGSLSSSEQKNRYRTEGVNSGRGVLQAYRSLQVDQITRFCRPLR